MTSRSYPDFYLQVLGANSAIPHLARFPSAFILGHINHLYLIDCGEGAQIKMSQYHVRRSKINHIFISHLHGDHVLGLPGLLNSFSLNGRQKELIIYGPLGIKQFVETFQAATYAHLTYPLRIVELEGEHERSLGRIDHLEVFAFPLVHRVPTFGYRFTEIYDEFNVNPQAISRYNLSVEEIKKIKKGQSITRNEEVWKAERFTLPKKHSRSFAYCSDTCYHPPLAAFVSDVSLLYHEATYLHNLQAKAKQRMHSTADEAARLAKAAGVSTLIIGHYSSRYSDLEPLLDEARAIFLRTDLAIGGKIYPIG